MFDQQVTFLPVADLEAAHRFYSEVLGLPLVLDQGRCRIYRCAPSAFVGVCVSEQAPSAGVIITLVTDAVDEWFEAVAARGAEVERRPGYNEEFDIYHAFLRDPDGHLVEIQQFRDPAWPSG